MRQVMLNLDAVWLMAFSSTLMFSRPTAWRDRLGQRLMGQKRRGTCPMEGLAYQAIVREPNPLEKDLLILVSVLVAADNVAPTTNAKGQAHICGGWLDDETDNKPHP